MKRYRDCEIKCVAGQTAKELLKSIEKQCIQKGYETDFSPSNVTGDALGVHINAKNLPISRLVLCERPENNDVSIVNIAPLPKSGVSQIEPETYNKILDVFIEDVLGGFEEQGNKIETNKEDYTLDELIPTSFGKLNTWLSFYPLSVHQSDAQRWYDFIISIHKNEKHLSSTDLGKYLKEECSWDDSDIVKTELRLERDLDLLEYYDSHQ